MPASAQGILPSSFDGWTGSLQPGVLAPDMHDGEHIASTAASQLAASQQEYGIVSGEQAAYSRANENDTLQVTLYRMKDPSGAYGMYSYLRSPDMLRADITDHSAMSRERALVLDGNLVLDIHGADLQRSGKDLNALVAAINPKAQQGPLPTISEHLPTKGFIDRSDKYILGPLTLNQFFPVTHDDWLGFGTGAEAEVARYHVDGRELNLLIADFPTPQTAQKKLNELQQDYHVNVPSTDPNGSPIFARRSITLLAIVSGARTSRGSKQSAGPDSIRNRSDLERADLSVQGTRNHYDDRGSDNRYRNHLLLCAGFRACVRWIPTRGEAIAA